MTAVEGWMIENTPHITEQGISEHVHLFAFLLSESLLLSNPFHFNCA